MDAEKFDVVEAGVLTASAEQWEQARARFAVLNELMNRQGPMPLADVIAIGIQLGKALDYAHSKGVVHRDIGDPVGDACQPELIDLIGAGIDQVQRDLQPG